MNAILEEIELFKYLHNPISSSKFVLRAVREEIAAEIKRTNKNAHASLNRLDAKVLESLKSLEEIKQ